MNTGSIVDFYDDPQGMVLREKVAHTALPDYVKAAHFYKDAERNQLPDDAFALVVFDRGHKMRKFACADAGNTALSVIYFLENGHKLPEEAQKVAAVNLCEACEAFGIEPPLVLKEAGIRDRIRGAASRVGKAAARFATKARQTASSVGEQAKQKFDQKVEEGIKEKAMPTINKEVEKNLKQRVKAVAKPVGLAAGAGAVGMTAGALAARKQEGQAKTASRYVDITGKTAPVRFEKRAHQHFCLVKEGQGRFPIDDYGQVMEATRWFEEHGNSLHPEDRREYCVKLAGRADALGISTTDRIRKYAGADYAPDGELKVAVCTRMQYWADDSPERDMLSGLMNKYASVPPEVFCEALKQFDEATGLHYRWDDGVHDPWYSTYGFTKEAEWVWQHGADRLTSDQLKQGVAQSRRAIEERFGEDVANELQKKPEQIFDSLPLDHKRIISRIVTDVQPGAPV